MRRVVLMRGETGNLIAVNPNVVRAVTQCESNPNLCDVFWGANNTAGARVRASFADVVAELSDEPVGKIRRGIEALG